MLAAYMDGSGTHAGSKVVAISGFLADENSWLEFDQKWNAVLDDPKWPSRLSEFHIVDCVHGENEFADGHWSFAQRLYLYGELCGLIRNSNIAPIGASVLTESFQKIPADDLALLSDERTRLGTPLDVCFQGLMQQIFHRVHEIGDNETVGIIFDQEEKPREEKFTDFCNHYSYSFYLGDHFAGRGFADSKKLTPLQAADLLAYGTFQLAHIWIEPLKVEPYFPVIPALWKMLVTLAAMPGTSPNGTVVDLEGLKAIVEKVKRGETLPKKVV